MVAKEGRIKDDEVYDWNIVRFYNEVSRLKAFNEMKRNEQFLAKHGTNS